MATIDGSYSTLLRDAARRLRELSFRAPEIMNELRQFADDLDAWADQLMSEAKE